MKAKISNFTKLLVMFLAAASLLLQGLPAQAQFLRDDFERERFIESDEGFVEEDEGFGVPRQEDEFSEGGRFVEEDSDFTTRRGLTLRSRRSQIQLAEERELLPLNAAWGAGTGLLIGGWFALISNGDNRDTQRSVGVGVVLGTLLGALVGTKTLIDPNAPRAVMHPSPENRSPGSGLAGTSLALAGGRFSLRFSLRF